jgi:hypothetical protein
MMEINSILAGVVTTGILLLIYVAVTSSLR